MHAKAVVNGQTIAETDNYEVVEGNIYFPPSSLAEGVFTKSPTSTHCPWKGDASYYNIETDNVELKDAAWYYPNPKEAAMNIKDYVAFYKNKVEVTSE